MNIKISAFKKLSDVNNPYNRDVFKCLERIRSGASKDKIEELRSTGKKEIKNTLPCYTFSGTFSNRSKIGLKEHSGLIILDFDHVGTFEDAENFRDSISDSEFVFSAFISPSGDGVKVLIKIPPIASDHELYYNAIYKHFESPYLDESGKDVSRLCFESYDSDIYINPESTIWLEKEKHKKRKYRCRCSISCSTIKL